MGRDWYSPRGLGLYLSILLRPDDASELTRWTLGAGLAAHRACRLAGYDTVEIKWPNDLLAGGLKLAGTLAEARSRAAAAELVIGTGFNVDHGPQDFPPHLIGRATSLAMLSAATPDREQLAADYLIELLAVAGKLSAGDWDSVRREWEAAAPGSRNGRVRVGEADGGFVGLTRGVDRLGALKIERPDGETVSMHLVDSVTFLGG